MADIEDLIYSRLSGFAGLAALVATRIYANRAPQNVTRPYIVFHLVTEETPQPQQVTGATDLIRARYQFDCYAENLPAARDVRAQLRLALKRWKSAGPPLVQVVFALTAIDLSEPETRLHNCTADYEINYEE